MFPKRKFKIDENSESCANIANNDLIDIFNSDSDNSDILSSVRKRKRLVIEKYHR